MKTAGGTPGFLALSVDLQGRDPEAAESACFAAGAVSVTLTDAVDDAILEPAPGEIRLWPQTVMQALFPAAVAGPEAIVALAGALVGLRHGAPSRPVGLAISTISISVSFTASAVMWRAARA